METNQAYQDLRKDLDTLFAHVNDMGIEYEMERKLLHERCDSLRNVNAMLRQRLDSEANRVDVLFAKEEGKPAADMAKEAAATLEVRDFDFVKVGAAAAAVAVGVSLLGVAAHIAWANYSER